MAALIDINELLIQKGKIDTNMFFGKVGSGGVLLHYVHFLDCKIKKIKKNGWGISQLKIVEKHKIWNGEHMV